MITDLIFKLNLMTPPLQTNNDTAVIIIIAGIIIAIVIYIGKILISKFIDRYFDAIDERNNKIDKFNLDLQKITIDIREIVNSLNNQKEHIEENQTLLENRILDYHNNVSRDLSKTTISLENSIDYLSERFHMALEQVKKDVTTVTIAESEHYKELRGKIEKQWNKIGEIKEGLADIKSAHNHFHNKHQ